MEATGSDAGSLKQQAIMEIMRDSTVCGNDRSRAMQLIHGGLAKTAAEAVKLLREDKPLVPTPSRGIESNKGSLLGFLEETLLCAVCTDIPVRPVTTPCQHNFCLMCFTKAVNTQADRTGKRQCPNCRRDCTDFARNPRINTPLVNTIREARRRMEGNSTNARNTRASDDSDRPDEAFVTSNAQRGGLANAARGKMKVDVPSDHFGPIPDVEVGKIFGGRQECAQWGIHRPPVSGIAGQASYGAQSICLSGGYADDKDHGEWFVYTGAGGRDLRGNKRSDNQQSKDQSWTRENQALVDSCIKGLPVRVIRSYKERVGSYAPPPPEKDRTGYHPVRYDGIYRILRCWRQEGEGKMAEKISGAHKFLVCKYLFVRCDSDPAPWEEGEIGDAADILETLDFKREPMPTELREVKSISARAVDRKCGSAFDEAIELSLALNYALATDDFSTELKTHGCRTKKEAEIKKAQVSTQIDFTTVAAQVVVPERGAAHWDWDAKTGRWGWVRAAPTGRDVANKSTKQLLFLAERCLKPYSCLICKNVSSFPLITPCNHLFCHSCLVNRLQGVGEGVNNQGSSGRTFRTRKVVKPCPADGCNFNISEFVSDPQVNQDTWSIIQRLTAERDAARLAVEDERREGSAVKSMIETPHKASIAEVSSAKVSATNSTSSTSLPSPRPSIRVAQNSQNVHSQLLLKLQSDFPSLDGELIKEILVDNEEDEKLTRITIRKMVNQMEKIEKADAKRRRI